MPTFHILTYGCQMNVNDSFWLTSTLKAHGFIESSLENADVVLINTCSVREKPEQKVINAIHRVKQATQANQHVIVGILGCVAQQLGANLMRVSPQVRLVAGPDQLAALPRVIEQLLTNQALKLSLLDFTSQYIERADNFTAPLGPTAYVNIMQGCDNFCTYCIVPYTRGRQKSRQTQAILEECKKKVELGAREITLLGQNVNAFGQDKSGDGTKFSDLLWAISEIAGLERLRYTSPHPKDMTDADILAFKTNPKLCPSLHLPLQSGSSRILKRMARGYTREDYLDLVNKLRTACPNLALTTDIIVGFPGETEADLELTLKMMEECQYSSSYSFCYSDRPGCAAVKFLDKINQEEQHERLNQVQELQDKLTLAWLQSKIGQSTTLLIEKKSVRPTRDADISWQGRDPYGTLVHFVVQDNKDYTGKMVEVTIINHGKHCLHAQQKSPIW